jgi:YD repeat-containing protein
MLFTINQVKGTLYIDDPNEPTRNDFVNMVSNTGTAPEITGMTGNAIGKTMYSNEDSAIIHLINYQYDWMQDKVKPPISYTLEITLPENLTDQTLTIRYITPETTETQLTYTDNGASIEVTIPSLNVWGIIHIATD